MTRRQLVLGALSALLLAAAVVAAFFAYRSPGMVLQFARGPFFC